jgi:hypothetical protein
MDVDHPDRDQSWDSIARSETETQRLDRNWASLLQELRVVQTGVQFLTGFLLVLPFQLRFRRTEPHDAHDLSHDSGLLGRIDRAVDRPGWNAPIDFSAA